MWNNRQWREVQRAAQALRRKGQRLFGILGDENGVINVPDRPGYQYVRVERGSERVTMAVLGNARERLNTSVKIEQDPITSEYRIVGVDVETTRLAGDDPATVLYDLPLHAESHGWSPKADDPLLLLNPLQMYFLRVQPATTTGHVVVQGGPYFVSGALQWKRESSDVDLTAYYPTSGAAWVMLCLDAEDVVTVVQKAGGGDAADIEQLGPIPAGTIALAAVKLTVGAPIDFFADIIPLWQVTQFDTSVLGGGGIEIVTGGLVLNIADYPLITGRWVGLFGAVVDERAFTGLHALHDTDHAYFGLLDEGEDRKDTVLIFGDNTDDHFIIYRLCVDGTLVALLDLAADGNIVPVAGATFDGVDVSAHAADAEAHQDAVTLDAHADTLLSLSGQELGLDAQAANTVLAGPTTGADVVPTFRALVAADLPAASTDAQGAVELATEAEAAAFTTGRVFDGAQVGLYRDADNNVLSRSCSVASGVEDATVLGTHGRARNDADVVFAGDGYMGNYGDSQATIKILRRIILSHTDTTWYDLYIDGASSLPVVASDTLVMGRVQLVGGTSGAANRWAYELTFVLVNDSGAVSLLTTSTTALCESDAAYDAQIVAGTTGFKVQVRRDGGVDYGIGWVASVLMTEVGDY